MCAILQRRRRVQRIVEEFRAVDCLNITDPRGIRVIITSCENKKIREYNESSLKHETNRT